MAITKEIKVEKIEVRDPFKHLQIATDTVVKEDGVEISRSRHRHTLAPCELDYSDDSKIDTNISGQTSEVQAVANALWTDAIKEAYRVELKKQKDELAVE